MNDSGQPDMRTPKVLRYEGGDYVSMEEYLRLNQRYLDFYSRQWIPVIERLPEKECRCLVAINGEVRSAAYYPPGKFQPAITHWMPLPEPPEVAI